MTAVSAPLLRPRRSAKSVTQTFTALAQATRSLGLQDRTRWFYLLLFTGLVVALGGAVTGLILLGDSWLQLLIAGVLGLIFTQFAFLGHEASHRQVLASGPANDRVGRVLATMFVGISYSWWMNKHTRHHANPNKIGKDPDIEIDTVSFHDESAATRRGLMAWITRRQGYTVLPAATGGRSQPPHCLDPWSAQPPARGGPHAGAGPARHPARQFRRRGLLAAATGRRLRLPRRAACGVRPLYGLIL